MKNFYFGSIVWNEEPYDIYLNREVISYRYTQQNKDSVYENKGLLRIGIKSVLKKAIFSRVINYNQNLNEILPFFNFQDVSDFCRLCYSGNNLNGIINEKSKEIIGYTYKGVETQKPQSRKVFYPKSFVIKKNVYCGLEFKGCGKEGETIVTDKFRKVGTTEKDYGCEGGLYLFEALEESEILKKMNKNSPTLIASFELPIEVNSPYYKTQKLGLLVRGVKCSIRISEMIETGRKIVKTIGARPVEYCQNVTENLFREVKQLFEMGYVHVSPTEQNTDALGNITDLSFLPRLKNYEDIYYNLLNYRRVANLLWKYTSGKGNKKHILETIKEAFGVKSNSLKKISQEIFLELSSKTSL
ncbi:MAG: hypothetical protein NZ942_02540 [Candidatus Aenigmarchaeota archaeon]|nr:hypothetical protein [Candidatus Aenigmarchaeota archaeon]